MEPTSANHFGTRRDREDSRDHAYSPRARTLPASADVSAFCGPVYTQGSISSCSAHAVSSAITWLGNHANAPIPLPSRLFIYYNARAFLNEQGTDAGATMRDAIKSIVKVGTCPETDWPYNVAQCTVQPPQPCYADASVHAVEYQRIERNLTHMKACLAEGYPFIFAMMAYEQTFTAASGNGGQLPMPAANPGPGGGHAVMAVGYTDTAIKALNSLGSSFGDKGFFYIPFAYFTQTSPELTYDFWTIRKIDT